MADEVISLAAVKSARRSDETNNVRIFRCIACDCYSFKVIEIRGESCLACANCETWIQEFDLVLTRAID